LILRKIIKIVATRFQILILKCTKSFHHHHHHHHHHADPAGGAYSPTQTL